MNRQKPAEVQATYYEWVELDCDTKDETVLATAGYKTRSFAASNYGLSKNTCLMNNEFKAGDWVLYIGASDEQVQMGRKC